MEKNKTNILANKSKEIVGVEAPTTLRSGNFKHASSGAEIPPKRKTLSIPQSDDWGISRRGIKKFQIENWIELLDKSLNEIYIFDKNTLLFEYVNFGAQKNLGYSQEQLLKMTPLDIKPEFTLTTFHSLIRPLIKHEKKVLIFETVHKRADGTRYPIEVHLQLCKQKERSCFLAFILDTTERKKEEEELSLQSAAFAASADAIAITDTKGIIQRVNNAFTTLTGYEGKEAIGHNMSIIKSGNYDKSYYEKFWNKILAGETIRKEIVNRRKDGTLYDEEEIVTSVKDNNGKITHFISIKHDITKRKEAEKVSNSQIIESEKITHIMVDRELRMVELKKTIKELEAKLMEEKK